MPNKFYIIYLYILLSFYTLWNKFNKWNALKSGKFFLFNLFMKIYRCIYLYLYIQLPRQSINNQSTSGEFTRHSHTAYPTTLQPFRVQGMGKYKKKEAFIGLDEQLR